VLTLKVATIRGTPGRWGPFTFRAQSTS